MPLWSSSHNNNSMSSDPAVRESENRIAGEERVDQKNLDHTTADLQKAERSHEKAIKSADKAQHNVDKAVSKEHKTAAALNKAQNKHDAAVADQQNAEKTWDLKKQHAERLEQDLEQRRSTQGESQHRKDVNDQQRELKLSDVHADAASRAGSRVNSTDHSTEPNSRNGTLNRGTTTGTHTVEDPAGLGPKPLTGPYTEAAPGPTAY